MAETTELKVVVSMVDEISGKLKATQDKLKGFSEGTRKVGTAFTAVGGAIVGGLGMAVMAAADAQKAQKQLEHTTLNVAHASKEELKALEDTSAALQKKGVLDGDNIKMGQAQLMTFGLSADMANQLSGSMADLAVNQFGVNASGEDMTQSANMIAKALNGQFGVLEKSGIRFTEAQQHLIQFGTESEKAATLQEGFAQNLKYTNEVAAQTLEGQIAKLNSTFGDMAEEIGGALIPIISDFVKKVQPTVENIIAWIGENEELVKKIVMVAAAIGAFLVIAGPLLIMLSFLPALIAGVGIALAIVTSPITGVIIAIMALIAAGVLLWKNWDAIKAKAFSVWESIKTYFRDTLNSIGSYFSTKWNDIKNQISNTLTSIVSTVQSKIYAMRDFIRDKLNDIVNAVKSFASPVSNAFATIWEGIKNTAASALGGIVNIMKDIINNVIGKINGFIGTVNGVASRVSNIPGVGDVPQVGNIPYLAKGGVVTKPTLAMIGEGNEPEAVIPLSKLGNMGGGGLTIIVNGDISGDELIDKVENAMIKRLKLSSPIV